MKKTMMTAAIVMMLLIGNALAADTGKENADVAAAKNWLSLTDAGKFSESWEAAAEYFKNAVPQSQWKQMLQAYRAPLGKVVSRRLKGKTYQTSLPGAPDGEYLVIQFETSFQNKKSASETITPMLDHDGTWRVSGYVIK